MNTGTYKKSFKISLFTSTLLYFYNIMSDVAWASGDKSTSDIASRIYSSANQNSIGFGLEYLKHLLFDEAILFTLFSAIALLIALLGAAIIIGKRV